jgi:hypothetical protein
MNSVVVPIKPQDVKTQVCKACGVEKPLSDFHKNPKTSLGVRSKCKPCFNAYTREEYRANPAHRRSGMKNRPDKLLRLYGITYADVVHTLDAQHGLCANRACGTPISLEVMGARKGRAVIDHDHKTGQFRALLCMSCNVILGVLENQENVILGLMEYLVKHPHKEH